eukprot:gene1381-1721_t
MALLPIIVAAIMKEIRPVLRDLQRTLNKAVSNSTAGAAVIDVTSSDIPTPPNDDRQHDKEHISRVQHLLEYPGAWFRGTINYYGTAPDFRHPNGAVIWRNNRSLRARPDLDKAMQQLLDRKQVPY